MMRISLLLPFFKGDSLASEFAFVNYYHSHPINRLLHTLAMPLLIFGVLTMFSSIDYKLSLIFWIFYCSVIYLFDQRTSIAFFILFGILLGPATIFSSQGILYGFGVFFTGLLLQGLGHFQFEKASPAFRIFEAIFTTPAFLMMYLITDHTKPFWNDVKNETNKWKQILNH